MGRAAGKREGVRRLILYTQAGCHASLRAKALLRERGLAFTERDLLRHPLSPRELRQLGAIAPLSALFAARSPKASAHAGADAESLLTALAAEPGLVRRPLLRHGERGLLIGFKAAEWAQALDALQAPEALTPGR